MMPSDTCVNAQAIAELAPRGHLRVAINMGNPILASRDACTGEPAGVSVDLAKELARLLNLPLRFVLYDAAGAVVAGSDRDEWDVAFVARDPLRAKGIAQTQPYVLIEGAYLVRESSPLLLGEEVDAPGMRIVVGKGSAYDLFLTRELKHATLVRAPTSPEVVEKMLDEGADVAAGVRQQVEYDAQRMGGLRLLPGRFMVIEQAMGTPKARAVAARLLEAFVAHALARGIVERMLTKNGIRGAVTP